MPAPVVNHLLRTLAAAPPDQRVLLRGPAGDGCVAHPLARLGFEVHAAPWTDDAARRVQEAVQAERAEPAGASAGAEAASSGEAQTAPVYATAAPLGALPYPEGHFGWVVVRGPADGGGAPAVQEASPAGQWQALLEEARHYLRPGGWVFVMAALVEEEDGGASPEVLDRAAEQAQLAEAEAPEHTEAGALHAIYRRVEADTPR